MRFPPRIACRRANKRIEHGLQIEGGAADDLEHVGGGGLLLTCVIQLPSEPCIFDFEVGGAFQPQSSGSGFVGSPHLTTRWRPTTLLSFRLRRSGYGCVLMGPRPSFPSDPATSARRSCRRREGPSLAPVSRVARACGRRSPAPAWYASLP